MRLRGHFLRELGLEPNEDLRRTALEPFTSLLAALEGTAREVAGTGSELALEWPEAEPLRHSLRAWSERWRLTPLDPADDWACRVALMTLAFWCRNPDAPAGWRHKSGRRRFLVVPPAIGEVMTTLEAEGREAAVRELRAGGLTRREARELLSTVLAHTSIVPRRARRNLGPQAETETPEEDEVNRRRGLRWLAAYCRGATDADTARVEGVTRPAVTLSNRRTATLLGLAYSPPRGRRRKQKR